MNSGWYSGLSHLECGRCGTRHDATTQQGLCDCGSPLLARYDLERVAAKLRPADLATRPPDLWRYRELLPVAEPGHVVSLGEGMTPLLALPRLGAELGLPGLLLKDEGLIPTGTFKARGAAVGVSRAAELGATGVAMPTNGNAGAAWAVYAARAGLAALIVMPVAAPAITRSECAAAGAELYLVDGLIGDAGALVAGALAARPGYQDSGTLKEPYRLEGKKTMGLEIAEQLGWRLPDVIVYPTGGGVGIIGIYKALLELSRTRLGRRRPAQARGRAGERLRPDRRARSPVARRSASRGPMPGRSRSGSPCPRRSATSWSSRPCAQPGAPRSPSTTRSCWPTSG